MSMLTKLRVKLRETLDEIDALTEEALSEDGDADSDEATQKEEALAERHSDAKKLMERIDQFEELEKTRAAAEPKAKTAVQQRGDTTETGERHKVLTRDNKGSLVKVARDPLTYEYGNRNRVFFRDLFHYSNRYNGVLQRIDTEAVEAIERHITEMQTAAPGHYAQAAAIERSVTTGGMASIVTPQYLLELYAPGLYDGAISRAVFSKHPLPEVGTEFTFPRNTTRGSTAPYQENNSSNVQESTPANTDTTMRLSTVAGFTDMTNQSMDRGVMVESIVANEIMGAYYEDINHQILFGDGTLQSAGAPQQRGLFSYIASNYVASDVNYSDGSPSIIKFWARLVAEVGAFTVARKKRPDAILTDPITHALLAAALDTTNRPLFGNMISTARNVVAIGDPAMSDFQMPEPVADLQGIPIWSDPAIPDTWTNTASTGGTQHRAALLRREDCILLESANGPVSATYQATEAKKLQQTLVVYGYIASTVERYRQGVRVLRGTGMVLG